MAAIKQMIEPLGVPIATVALRERERERERERDGGRSGWSSKVNVYTCYLPQFLKSMLIDFVVVVMQITKCCAMNSHLQYSVA